MDEILYLIIKLREVAASLGYEIDLEDARNLAESMHDKFKQGTGIIDHDIAVKYFRDN